MKAIDTTPIVDQTSGVTYTPWQGRNGEMGYAVTHPNGGVSYAYLNPSDATDTDDEPNVFVYAGWHGDPAIDQPHTSITMDVQR